MKTYLSYGGGVGSTALLLWMMDKGWNFEAVFVNHGGDWPETYEYVEMINRDVKPITEVIPDYYGNTIYEHAMRYRIIPMGMN
ncbi:MAG TPA: phosphoadenosine phosphosulfate reductase family protein, partial [Synergistales bacterium]|nr:phosphoadenosine phosphosulfate reductase family protein [Synergistales bacterium]